LTSDVYEAHAEIDGTPVVQSVNDFELCRAPRENDRNRRTTTGLSSNYEVLDTRRALRDYGFLSWETLFLQFKSDDGELLPITATIPSVDDDDDVVVHQTPADVVSEDSPAVRSTNKGKKRKAASEDEYSE